MNVPPITANARSSLEIEDSCNCASNCCWGGKKTKQRKKPQAQPAEIVIKRVDEVAASKIKS